jgi:Ca-activated chloride channel family protein
MRRPGDSEDPVTRDSRHATRLVPAAAFAVLLCAGLAVSAQGPIRVGVDLVHFSVVVTDRRGAPVTGLTADDFELLERGQPQRVKFFAASDAAIAPPLHLGFLLDVSGSMEKEIREVRSAAIKFLNRNEHARDVTLVDFDTEIRVARYRADDFPRLIERIRMRKPDGYTAFYDALGVYLRGASTQDGQKILVAYTDGGDTRSTINAGEVAELLKLSDVTMYTIGYLQGHTTSTRAAAQMELQRFSAMTGGQAFFPSSVEELDAFYEKIQQEIAGRYTLGYSSSDERADGSWRPVEIKVKRSDLRGAKVRTRPGYFARLDPRSSASR